MKNPNIQNIEYWYETITAYKQGELSEQQTRELFRWKEEHPEHAVFFEEVVETWEVAREKMVFPDFDVTKAWAKVKEQTIEAPQPIERSLWNTIFQAPLFKAAAAVLLLITLTWAVSKVMISKPTFTDLQSFKGMKEFYLPDSSKVYLHDTTTLRYSSTYGEDERMVYLDGEAFFEVRKNAAKPFTVLSYRSRVIVKGTSFMVCSRSKDSVDVVEVEEGKVAVLEKYSRSGKELMLTKGMKACVDTYGGLHQSSETISNTAAWRNKPLVFVGTPLADVLKELKSKRNTIVILDNKQTETCRFTGEFENTSATDIVQIIALSLNLQVVKQGNTFILKGDGCK